MGCSQLPTHTSDPLQSLPKVFQKSQEMCAQEQIQSFFCLSVFIQAHCPGHRLRERPYQCRRCFCQECYLTVL